MTVDYISDTVHIVCTIECTMYVQRAQIETNGDPTPGLLKRASTTTQRHPQHTHCTFNTTHSAETSTIHERASNTTHIHASPHITITITLLNITRTIRPPHSQHHIHHTNIHITQYALLTLYTCTTTDLYNGHIARTLGATICSTCFCEKDDKANAQWILLTNTHNHQIKIHDNKKWMQQLYTLQASSSVNICS